MLLRIDPDRCIGAAQCVTTAPRYFDQDEDGRVTFVGEDNAPVLSDEQRALLARLCPSGALNLPGS